MNAVSFSIVVAVLMIVVALLSSSCSREGAEEAAVETAVETAVDAAVETAAALTAEEIYAGRCAACHGGRAEGVLEQKTPSMAGMPDWYLAAQMEKFANETRSYLPADGSGQRMSFNAHKLEKEYFELLAGYVAAMEPVPTVNTLGGSPARGQVIYRKYCEECHFPEGKGDWFFRTPPLTVLPDWYMAAQLEKFRSLERGGHLRDPKGPEMIEPATRLANAQEEKDVLAYIAFLAGWRPEAKLE